MPRRNGRITLALLAASACTPSEFVWSEARGTELQAYLASFAAACGDGFDRRASEVEMLEALRNARLVWLGDHHESERLHVLQRDLLARIVQSGAKPTFVLEAVGVEDDAAVARFLRGDRSLAELRTEIAARWPASWLDEPSMDAAFYRDVLEFAKTHGIPVFGAEPTPRIALRDRDAAIAQRVRQIAAAAVDRTVVVIVGQAHLVGAGDLVARTGLPAVVLGGIPPARLRNAAPWPDDRGFFHSTGGLWWFAAMVHDAPQR